MYKKTVFVFLIVLLLPVALGVSTCSEYWGDCSSRTIDDAFDPCDGKEVGGDEHVSEIYVEKGVIEPNKIQTAKCTFVPTKYWSVDRVYIYYYNGKNWTKLLDDVAKYRYTYNESKSFNVGSKEGEKIVRCIISRDLISGECAKVGSYYDNDDLKFIVKRPLKCDISCSEKEEFSREEKLNCEYSCNKNVNLFYSVNSSEEIPIQATKGSFSIDFLNFPEGGNYNIKIFAKNISEELIYSKNITLKSKAIVSSISVPDIVKKETEISCEVKDFYTNKRLDDYEVSFFVDGDLIGSSLTEKGVASITYSSGETGDKNISCSIKGSKFYFGDSKKSKTVYFSEFEISVDVEELKEMENKLEELREDYYHLSSYSNVSGEFTAKLNQIEKGLKELETYLREGQTEAFKEKSAKIENKIGSLQWEMKVNSVRNLLLSKYFLVFLAVIISVPLIYKFYTRKKKQQKLLNFYKNRERELIEKRKQIEKDYFARKIDESYFNRLLLENYNKLSKVKAKIKELSQE